MSITLHWLRPWWLLLVFPLFGLFWFLYKKRSDLAAWQAVCDPALLHHLIRTNTHGKRRWALLSLLLSSLLMVVSLAGPTWSKWPAPTYRSIQPRVVVLDMSSIMLEQDLTPDRLTRAKFKLHDLLQQKDIGQVGLVVFSGDAFVVSPLTDDAETIDSLLSSLQVDLMPVEGHALSGALEEAGKLIQQAGFQRGEILVFTAVAPSEQALQVAQALAQQGIHTSVIPSSRGTNAASAFQSLATAGNGVLIPFSDTSSDLLQWLTVTKTPEKYRLNAQQDIPLWRDQGRWFLLPALLLLLPIYRRGWLERIGS